MPATATAVTLTLSGWFLTSFVAIQELLAERDVLAARLHTMAFTDGLTGLANRALFLERLEDALRRGDSRVGVLIDLDDIKPVNDTYGHAAGDAVLMRTAERLRLSAGSAGVTARLGGDEFAVLIEQAQLGDLAAVADRIVEALGEPCRLEGGTEVRSTPASGAMAADDDRDASALLHRADGAMYAAKRSGKGSFELAHAA
ncbi:GGDEF domain-containing protein [Actinoplanes sp. NBC_00393]|uniref:GGDEF domain-containing protein n=1 Tax=Actinoplanes sp. NBC_00393 TaxID=2975953 RepID=UPI002E1D8E9D